MGDGGTGGLGDVDVWGLWGVWEAKLRNAVPKPIHYPLSTIPFAFDFGLDFG